MKPWISIVVPSFNQAQFLEATLRSLLDQREKGLEILVADAGSKDGSVDIIRRHADRLAWWVSEPDRGQSHALNKGFARATGDWLGWLNSDDLLLPGALQTLRRHIDAHPDRAWWIGGGHFIDDKGRRFRDFGPPAGLTEPRQLSDWRRFWFAQPSTFFRRRLYDAAGGQVREDLHYALDLELWLRFLERAAPGLMEADVSVYRLHAAGKTQALSVPGEAEIVSVVAERLGIPAAMDRVRNLAAERDSLQVRCRKYEAWLAPLLNLNRWTKPARRLLGVGKTPK